MDASKAQCVSCPDAHAKTKALQQDIKKWELYNKNLKCMKSKFRRFGCYTFTIDSKVIFFTGFKSKRIMESVFGVLQKHSHGIRYWTNPKRAAVFGSKVRRRIHKANRVLTFKDKLLMTFMRLRLGLLETDLAVPFVVSPATVSRITTTLTKFIANCFR